MSNEVVVIHTLREVPGLFHGTSEWQGVAGGLVDNMQIALWTEDRDMLEFAGYEIKEGPVNIPVIPTHYKTWRIKEILGKEYTE